MNGKIAYACENCAGERWVCERHPDKPWTSAEDGCDCAPGVPCPECNLDDFPADPPGFTHKHGLN